MKNRARQRAKNILNGNFEPNRGFNL
jgi:hypothetical protein